MTKKTIMELLREADEKEDSKGRYYMDRLFSHAMDDANELHFESIEQHVAVHILDALERIANVLEENGHSEQAQTQSMLTYHDFFKAFNAISSDYHARKSDRGGVDIVLNNGELRASLLPHVRGWYFTESGFHSDELTLMAQLAATLPELRGEINDD